MIIALAIASTLASIPVDKPVPDAPPTPAVQAERRADGPRRPAKPTIYCVDAVMTGSRLTSRTCRTRAEWLAFDFDPLAKD